MPGVVTAIAGNLTETPAVAIAGELRQRGEETNIPALETDPDLTKGAEP